MLLRQVKHMDGTYYVYLHSMNIGRKSSVDIGKRLFVSNF